jgi:hypothetical protein
MGIFCMVFGVVIFIAFLFAGYLLASMLVMEGLLNVLSGASISLSQLFQVPNAGNIGTYAACIALLGFIGLMIGLGVFMNGMIYNRMNRLEGMIRRRNRKREAE